MFNKLYAIAANTFTETIRQPIFFVLTAVAAGLIALSPALAAFSLDSGSDIKIMKDVGLATMLLYGLLTSVFSAAGVITREIESYTVLTVISKPVSRPLFILGKYLGVTAAMAVGYYFLSLVFLMAVRHGVMETVTDPYDRPVLLFGSLAVLISLIAATFGNYVYGWHFITTITGWIVPLGSLALGLVLFFGPRWEPQPPGTDFGDYQMVYAVALAFCGVMILTAFAVALSTRLSQVMTLLICTGIYFLGLVSDYYIGQHVGESLLAKFAYGAVPNFQFFWVGDAITQELPIPGVQVAWVAGYTACYTLAILSLAVALFQTREVG